MVLITAIFFLSLSLYCLVLLVFLLGLFSKKEIRSQKQPFVSVIIPAKNEKDNIGNILFDVTHQTYPRDKYEIIIIDDESTDITPNICNAFVEKYPNVTLLSTKGFTSPLRYKKKPLDLGISHANGEIILLTDADCHVASTWIESMVSYFTPEVGMVIGYSETSPVNATFEKIQALDFLMLMSAARGTAQLGLPYACTGQNLAYRKGAFKEVGGFSAFANSVGGDDTLLLHQIKQKTRWKIVFALDSASFASSPPLSSLRAFITQRIRWAADTISIKDTDPLFFSIIVTTFLANLMPVILTISLLFSSLAFLPLIKGLTFKFALEGLLMLKGTTVFKRKELISIFPAWFFFQIPYITLMGILSFFGNRFSWGGRLK